MVDFSHIAKRCEEYERSLTEEQREERRRVQSETLRRIERERQTMERLLRPSRALSSTLDSVAAAQRALEPLRLAEVSRAASALASSPALSVANALSDGPTAMCAGILEQAQEAKARMEALASARAVFPELSGLDRLRKATDALRAEPSYFRPLPSALVMPPVRTRDEDQDERFEKLTDVVVEQTGQVVELRKEVREVRDSAARDAFRGRRQSTRQSEAGTRLQWWHLVLSAVLGGLVSKLLSMLG
ncbi:MAG: hypothetical protein ACE37K_13510 [Planctomycetota bacterium]